MPSQHFMNLCDPVLPLDQPRTAGSFWEKKEPGTQCLRMHGYYVITLSAVTLATYSFRSQDFSSTFLPLTFLPLTFLHLSVLSEALAQVGNGEIFSLHPPYNYNKCESSKIYFRQPRNDGLTEANLTHAQTLCTRPFFLSGRAWVRG